MIEHPTQLIATSGNSSLSKFEVHEALMERGFASELTDPDVNPRSVLKAHCQFVTLLVDDVHRKNAAAAARDGGEKQRGSMIRTTEDTATIAAVLVLTRMMELQK